MTVSATPIPVWPVARIPLPNVEGYAITPGEALVRTDMESGAARARRRFTQTPANTGGISDSATLAIPAGVVPEPSSITMVGMGLAALGVVGARRKRMLAKA